MRAICCILSAIIICFNLFATPSWESPVLHNGQLRLDGQLYKRMGLGMLSGSPEFKFPIYLEHNISKYPFGELEYFSQWTVPPDIVCRADKRRHILAFPRWRGIFLQMEQQKLSDTRIQTYPHKNSVYSIQGQRKTGARQNLHNIEGPLRLCLRQRGAEIARSAVGQKIVFQNQGNPHYGNRTAR